MGARWRSAIFTKASRPKLWSRCASRVARKGPAHALREDPKYSIALKNAGGDSPDRPSRRPAGSAIGDKRKLEQSGMGKESRDPSGRFDDQVERHDRVPWQ